MSVVEATLEPTSGSQPLRDLVGELQKACKDIGDLGASLLLLRKWFTRVEAYCCPLLIVSKKSAKKITTT